MGFAARMRRESNFCLRSASSLPSAIRSSSVKDFGGGGGGCLFKLYAKCQRISGPHRWFQLTHIDCIFVLRAIPQLLSPLSRPLSRRPEEAFRFPAQKKEGIPSQSLRSPSWCSSPSESLRPKVHSPRDISVTCAITATLRNFALSHPRSKRCGQKC